MYEHFSQIPQVTVTEQPAVGSADLLVTNSTRGFTISGIAASAWDTTGTATFSEVDHAFLAEVKTLNPDGVPYLNEQSLLKGDEQIVKIGALGPTGVLIVDQDAWANISQKARG
jgi:hypothetical protein